MKKLFTAMIAAMLMAGCAQQKPAEPAETAVPEATATAVPEETAKTEETALAEIPGGWTVNTDFNTLMTDDDLTRIETVLAEFVGTGFTPAQVIATQVVNGTNYAYLALGETVTADPVSSYYVLVVNETPSKEVSLINIKKIDLADIRTKDSNETLLGGWQATGTGKPGMLPGQEAQESFDKACESLEDGLMLNPVVLLGTQVAAGTNYAALCRGRRDGEDDYTLYVTKWFSSVDGTSEITSNELFDLEYYTTPGIEGEPIVGEWELTRVEAAVPGKEAEFMKPEENASLYGDPAYYVFNEDGTGTLNVIEGSSTEELKGTWTVDAGVYTFTRDGDADLSVVYDAATDRLVRVYKDESANAPYSEIKFFYTRR
ncbi:MAG: lipocalin family protein [Solobacterium sp.]|nr:lipocalin family protein [Solobacterium sp.]